MRTWLELGSVVVVLLVHTVQSVVVGSNSPWRRTLLTLGIFGSMPSRI